MLSDLEHLYYMYMKEMGVRAKDLDDLMGGVCYILAERKIVKIYEE